MAIKIILKKNVKGNERMVYDELDMLQSIQHNHIVKFVDWFESRVSWTHGIDDLSGNRNRLTFAAGQVLHRHRASHRW